MSDRIPTGFKCLNCGKIHYPKHGRCLKCKYREFEEINLPSVGTLVTFTHLKAPPSGIKSRSLFLGIIDLGEVRYTGQLDIDDIEQLKIGMKLTAKWKHVRTIDNRPINGFIWSIP
jgi:uncharacterized OB-fold protein